MLEVGNHSGSAPGSSAQDVDPQEEKEESRLEEVGNPFRLNTRVWASRKVGTRLCPEKTHPHARPVTGSGYATETEMAHGAVVGDGNYGHHGCSALMSIALSK